jgi:tetratricopeptide (TPR) repeat protein
MGCFSYAVETTASGVGWWRWNIIRPSSPFFVGGTHAFGIVEWMSVAFDFLIPFLLFRTDKGWRLPAAWLSLLLYPIHWATHWKQVTAPGYPHSYEIYHALISLSVIALPLLQEPRLAPEPRREAPGWVQALPWVAILGMFFVLGWADAGVLGEPELLLSLLPLAAYLALAVGTNGQGTAASVAAAGLILAISLLGGRGPAVALARTVPVLVPMACVLAYGGRSLLVTRAGPRRLYAAGLVLITAVTASGMVRGKREREAYSRLVDQARTLVSLGDAAGAESVLKRAIALKPGVNLGRTYLANLYAGQGRYDEAWEHVQRSLDLDPTDQEVYRQAGEIQRARARCAEAAPYYERALLLNPADTESARGLGDCYLRTGRIAGAIDVYRRALVRKTGDPEMRRLLGAALVQTRRFSEAEKVVGETLEENPGDAASHLLMAFIRAGLGDVPAARVECEKVLQITPGDAQATKLLESLPKDLPAQP